ncbi:MAG: protein-glutamate O-methyltransferase CheR [Lachnospiraceae bacterium]|nr:protein-glutamate O-methyltransferase CheR [Lachnospiraceae bacterium]
MANDYESFKKNVYDLTKIDLNAYKERQMKRRIDTLIARNKYTNYDDYVRGLRTNKELFDEFVNYLTINVSEFYRNPQLWDQLDKEIFPELVKRFGNGIKIWSAACSTGDEPYSLVMVLAKHIPISKIKIIATDIDKQVLDKARAGLYSAQSLKGLPEEYKKKYFTQVGNSFQISDEVKKCVDFRSHNLLKDPYPKDVNLIVCRNVVIYFTEEAKDEIYRKFYQSLTPGGSLFVGSTEQIINYKQLGYTSKRLFFYDKPC